MLLSSSLIHMLSYMDLYYIGTLNATHPLLELPCLLLFNAWFNVLNIDIYSIAEISTLFSISKNLDTMKWKYNNTNSHICILIENHTCESRVGWIKSIAVHDQKFQYSDIKQYFIITIGMLCACIDKYLASKLNGLSRASTAIGLKMGLNRLNTIFYFSNAKIAVSMSIFTCLSIAIS